MSRSKRCWRRFRSSATPEFEPLAGGLTNMNYKVTTPAGCFVVRISGKDTGLLAIDRENEVHNTDRGRRVRRRRRVRRVPAGARRARPRVPRGRGDGADDLRRGDRLGAIATRCRRLHAGRRFLHDFDMFEIQPRYLEIVRERGFRCRTATSVRAADPRLERALRVRPEPPVPCNNDLLAENFIDVGGAFRLIDYEYSGNNEPLRARQRLERVEPLPRPARGVRHPLLGRPRPTRSRERGCGA